LGIAPTEIQAQEEAMMLRHPDVSATRIVFVHGGDIWVVPKEGGSAQRLTSTEGEDEFPRFSPDGSRIAFNGTYQGNTDIHVIPVVGGEPVRITHHPMPARLLDWYPDGERILFASGMESGRQRFLQFYSVSSDGGLPERLPIPYGEFGRVSGDGNLLAYVPHARDYRFLDFWKRYRGGHNSEVWLFDLGDSTAVNVTQSDATDTHPMWHGRTVYFLSDRGPEMRHNIWRFDLDSEELRQVTRFIDQDLSWPSIGPDEIVFQAGGRIHLLDLETESTRAVPIKVVSDFRELRPRMVPVGDLVQHARISPDGTEALFEARGEVFVVSAAGGVTRTLTNSSGVAERSPAWSPDGDTIAYWSDRSGEYELTLRASDGSGSERTVTSLGPGYRYRINWSPDGRRIAFLDETFTLNLVNVETGEARAVAQSATRLGHDQVMRYRVSWSADGRWMAYALSDTPDSNARSLHLLDVQAFRSHRVTSGYYGDYRPTFDPGGEWLYYLSRRSLEPLYSDLDATWVYANATRVMAVPLGSFGAGRRGPEPSVHFPAIGEKGEGVERRATALPVPPGNYGELRAVTGGVVYVRRPRTGESAGSSRLIRFDAKTQQERVLADGFRTVDIGFHGGHALVASGDGYRVVDLSVHAPNSRPIPIDGLEAWVVPREEWLQIFSDVWRLQRDFFYDPNMHGIDWEEVGRHYRGMVERAPTRSDVNVILGEMIAELNAGHQYIRGGDVPQAPVRRAPLLGVDWELHQGAYRIRRIVDGAAWDDEVRSPLLAAGVEVGVGDYVLAVNGVPMDTSRDPWATFETAPGATINRPVSDRCDEHPQAPDCRSTGPRLVLTVNDRPTIVGARQVVVGSLLTESRLRYLEWLEGKRRYVEAASAGRIGYIQVPNTGVGGQGELVRQFSAQFTRPGLIIDERFNSGGQFPDRFVELLDRPLINLWSTRHGSDIRTPYNSHMGPKAMLINGVSGSGGDAFPWYFQARGLGPVIGERTWGALIGLGGGTPSLIDGGRLDVPNFRMYDLEGEWYPEGHGTEPDIHVVSDPGELARGRDPQLDRAIQAILEALETGSPGPWLHPKWEDRSGPGGVWGPPPPGPAPPSTGPK
jgi:tricorn protease